MTISANKLPADIGADVVGIGILGAGRVASQHVAAMDEITGVALRGVADLDRERAAALTATAGGTPYRDYQDLLARDDVDAVIVALPHSLHGQAVADAADAGKHVLVEKPMALTLDDCDRMIAACARRDVRLQVGLTYHFHPASAAARDLIASGELGKPVLGLEVLHGARRPESQPDWIMQSDWGGGQLWSNGVHLIDRAMHLVGKRPRVVKALVGTKMHDIDTDDAETILLEFDDGVAVTVIASGFYAGVGAFYGHYVLTRGMVNLPGKRLEVASGDERAYRDVPVDAGPSGFARQLAAFARSIREGTTAEVDGQWGRAVTEVILAAFESSRSGREIVLPHT